MAPQRKNALIHDQTYRDRLVLETLPDYNIEWTSPHRAVVEPKKQPSRLQATVFPMCKTRFKYEILFDGRTGQISHDDLLKITFNRSNGATVEQQERIFEHRKQFATRIQEMQARVKFDQDVADKKAIAPSAAA